MASFISRSSISMTGLLTSLRKGLHQQNGCGNFTVLSDVGFSLKLNSRNISDESTCAVWNLSLARVNLKCTASAALVEVRAFGAHILA